MKSADPRLVVLAPFTVPREQGKKSLISKGRVWKEEVGRVYPAHSVPDALNVMGLFILNRFRGMTREEVIAMLNFDLRYSEKTYYPKISQRRKDAEKGSAGGFPRFSLRLCAFARDIKWGNAFFPSPLFNFTAEKSPS